MVSLLQFTFAVLIIAFHNQRIFPSDEWNFIQKNVISRLAVPFFIIASAFFVRWKTEQKKEFQQKYTKKYIKTYLIWSLIYLPYGWMFFSSLGFANALLPLGAIVALLYVGMCYHLWYLPAFLFGSFFINKFNKHVNLLMITLLAFSLFLVGSIETYQGYFANTWLTTSYESYARIFFTTRNGLFFTPVFVCLGYLLYDYRNHPFLIRHQARNISFSFLILCFEAWFIFKNPGVDKNFLIGLIPTTFFLFNWSMRTRILFNRDLHQLKKLSVLYFFIHPMFIEGLRLTNLHQSIEPYSYAWVSLIITLIGTHLMALCLLFLQDKQEQILLRWRTLIFNRNRLG